MNHKKQVLYFLVIFCLIFSIIPAQEKKQDSELLKRIKAIPGVKEVKDTPFDAKNFTESYEIMFEQPIDHAKPKLGKFQQRFYILHKDYTSPVLLETEGYQAPPQANRARELTRILGGNQVYVEHRYFGRSVPKKIDWQYLTVKNSAGDLHRIVTELKKIYTGKWISSGGSKSGQTSIFFKTYYPNDVDVSVPFVAPVNLAVDDPRIYIHLDTVGTREMRKKVADYQIALLKRQDEIMPLMKLEMEKRKQTFSKVKFEEAYELGIMEFEFSLWQYGAIKFEDIPAPDAPKEKMVEQFMKVGGIDFFSDQSAQTSGPFFYQAFHEIGFYNYDITNLKPYLKYAFNPDFHFLCPTGKNVKYNPEAAQKVYNFLQYEGNNMIFIYGEYDTWSSTGINLTGRTNSIKIVKKGGFHNIRIATLPVEQKELIYTTLEKWLGVKVNHL